MRVIYLGTPEFAVPTLEALVSWPEAEVVAVVTQPDRPVGRGHKVQKPPTKVVAEAHGITVFQPEKLSKSPETVEAMRALHPDVLVMVAFGQILKKPVLEMAPMGVVNLHGSLLPRYRGPAPINWAIINGESVTGLTTMLSDAGVDTGPMLLKQSVHVGPDMTAEELSGVLASIGAPLVVETLRRLKAGTLVPEAQDDRLATHAPLLKKEMGAIDWSSPAAAIHNLVRGLVPWPGAYTFHEGSLLKLWKSAVASRTLPVPVASGTVVSLGAGIQVACGPDGRQVLELMEVQPANRARLRARDWANGVRLQAGTILGQLLENPVSS
jgi:methionyl-tRNA formyltransferase